MIEPTAIESTAIQLTAAQQAILGKATYRGFFGLTDAEADDAWVRLDGGPNAVGQSDYVSAAVEVVNALQWLPAEVRDHLATVLMGGEPVMLLIVAIVLFIVSAQVDGPFMMISFGYGCFCLGFWLAEWCRGRKVSRNA